MILLPASLPAGARRLFPGYDQPADLAVGSFVVGRLLEDGDGADLAWLCESVPEADLAAWLARHGGRRLSRRSRAFWEVVLGRPSGPAAEAASRLWPL